MQWGIGKLIRSLFMTSMPDSDKKEFALSIIRINVVRARITAIAFVIVEALMLLIHYIANRENLFSIPYVYYGSMYIIMMVGMIVFYVIFTRLGADVSKHISGIRYTGIFYISFLLLWCAGISLLDQLTSGQVIVYIAAVISIAITPFYQPFRLFVIYATVHSLFLIAMPYVQSSAQLLLRNILNSTTFVIMSWVISYMRYKKQAEDFYNKKLILKKNDELRLINMQLQEANQRLEIMTMTDGLTGVANRLGFETAMKEEWSRCRRHSIPLSLIILDVDYFKEFNDNYGHQAGDSCIKLIADVLTDYAKRSSDKVARYGGDEFAVLLPHTDKEDAFYLAEQMRKGVEEKSVPHLLSTVSDYVTISLGINTIIPSDESSIDEFIRSTDKALYMAKKRRNCSVFAMQQLNYMDLAQ